MKENIRNRVQSCGVKLCDCWEALADADDDDVVFLERRRLLL